MWRTILASAKQIITNNAICKYKISGCVKKCQKISNTTRSVSTHVFILPNIFAPNVIRLCMRGLKYAYAPINKRTSSSANRMISKCLCTMLQPNSAISVTNVTLSAKGSSMRPNCDSICQHRAIMPSSMSVRALIIKKPRVNSQSPE